MRKRTVRLKRDRQRAPRRIRRGMPNQVADSVRDWKLPVRRDKEYNPTEPVCEERYVCTQIYILFTSPSRFE